MNIDKIQTIKKKLPIFYNLQNRRYPIFYVPLKKKKKKNTRVKISKKTSPLFFTYQTMRAIENKEEGDMDETKA